MSIFLFTLRSGLLPAFAAVFILCGCASTPPSTKRSAASPPPADGIVAVVNDHVIKYSTIKTRVADQEARLRAACQAGKISRETLAARTQEIRQHALQDEIDFQLILQAGVSSHITLPPGAVEQYIDTHITPSLGGPNGLEEALRNGQLTMAQFQEKIREFLVVQTMEEMYVNRFTTNKAERARRKAAWIKSLRAKAYIKTF